jgi:hypothetical protein
VGEKLALVTHNSQRRAWRQLTSRSSAFLAAKYLAMLLPPADEDEPGEETFMVATETDMVEWTMGYRLSRSQPNAVEIIRDSIHSLTMTMTDVSPTLLLTTRTKL